MAWTVIDCKGDFITCGATRNTVEPTGLRPMLTGGRLCRGPPWQGSGPNGSNGQRLWSWQTPAGIWMGRPGRKAYKAGHLPEAGASSPSNL